MSMSNPKPPEVVAVVAAAAVTAASQIERVSITKSDTSEGKDSSAMSACAIQVSIIIDCSPYRNTDTYYDNKDHGTDIEGEHNDEDDNDSSCDGGIDYLWENPPATKPRYFETLSSTTPIFPTELTYWMTSGC